MTRACTAPWLALLTAACGGVGRTPEPPSHTVRGSARAHHLRDSVPDAAALQALAADAFVGDAFWALAVRREGAAGFVVEDVPEEAGPLHLRFEAPHPEDPVTRSLVTAAPAVDVDVHGLAGRPDAPPCAAPPRSRLRSFGSIHPDEDFWLVVPDVGLAAVLRPEGALDASGVLTGTWVWPGRDRRCPDAAAGDAAWVLRGVGKSLVGWGPEVHRSWWATSAVGPLAPTFAPPGTPAPLLELPFEWGRREEAVVEDRTTFLASAEAAGEPMHAAPSGRRWTYRVDALPPGGGPGAPLLFEENAPGDAVRVRHTLKHAMPADWPLRVTLEVRGDAATVGRRAPLQVAREADWALGVRLTPPRALALSLPPAPPFERATPVLHWTPPAVGSPTWYAVGVWREVHAPDTLPALRLEAELFTRDTALRLPPGTLRPGRVVLEVRALAPEGAPPELGARSVGHWPVLDWAARRLEVPLPRAP